MSDSPRPYPGMCTLPISRPAASRLLLALAALLATPLAQAASRRTVAPHPASPVHAAATAHNRRSAGTTVTSTAAAHVFHDKAASASPKVHAASARLATGKHPANHSGKYPAPSSTAAAATHGKRTSNALTAATPSHPEATIDVPAGRSTQDRIHAWYRTQQAAHSIPPGSRTLASAHPPAEDLSPTPRKATAADFDRAAAAQRLTIQSQADQNSRQTTAADDAADAESHIPSTAPTEREPAPFLHGDLPVPAVNGARRIAAPVVRQSPETPKPAPSTPAQAKVLPAQKPVLTTAVPTSNAGLQSYPSLRQGSEPTVDLSAPAALTRQPAPALTHIDRHTADFASRTGRVPLPASDAAVLAANPMTLPADSSSRTLRAVAAETSASATPRLQLPAPPPAGRKPAIAAMQAGTAHLVLDPAVTAGMADETFDGDSTTAATAIRLATTGTAPRSHAAPDPAGDEAAAAVNVAILDDRGHLLLLPPMKGTHDILVHQNTMALADGLERIQNDAQLADMRRTNLLVALPDDQTAYPNDALPLNRRFARPWTVRFIRDLARAHYARFGAPLIVTSAVRTVAFQRQLVRTNGNAAPPTGDIASPHLYGQAIDIAKHTMSLTEITWMRAYLAPVEDEGKIDVEEEFQQSCFHISVYRRYLGAPPAKKTAPPPPTLLQAKTTPAPVQDRKHHLPTALLATHLP